MNFSMELRTLEARAGDWDKINEKLRARFAQERLQNPRGYMDAWEMRFDLHMDEIAHELGLWLKVEGTNYIFSDSPRHYEPKEGK